MSSESSGPDSKAGDKIAVTGKDGQKTSCELVYIEKLGSYWEARVICPDGMTESSARSGNKRQAIMLACQGCPD